VDLQISRSRMPKRFSGWWLLIALLAGVGVGGYFAPDWKAIPGRQTSESPRGSIPILPPIPHSTHPPDDEHLRHVWPGMDIQDVLEAAATDPAHKVVRVHEGVYYPQQHAQAMIYFNARHDGITLEAEGAVILTAANPEIADPTVMSFPAVVNHVVYFGDGVTRRTSIRGFKITGAKNFVTFSDGPLIELAAASPPLSAKEWVYYADGGGIKIWGRSSPWIDRVEIYDSYTFPCAGAISIDNRGHLEEVPLITNSIFRNNRSQWTGSAIDMFGAGNAGEIRNCLFVGNVANRGYYTETPPPKFHDQNGSGALTIFPGSTVIVDHCTFTGNYNGVDDESIGSIYTNCIFWKNDARGGVAPGKRYELDIRDASNVNNCWFGGSEVIDLRGTIPTAGNTFDAPDPDFDEAYRPRCAKYADVGYRPVGGATATTP
jgi:hypothetical protein